MQFSDLVQITGGESIQKSMDRPITRIITDSRNLRVGEGVVFVAIKGVHHNGHQFIPELYHAGVRQFVISEEIDLREVREANICMVDHSINALQKIAGWHRSQFDFEVVGITGSNGKTIVKEWLFELLAPEYNIVKSPQSYNSQLGVPLSVWQMNENHDLGIFEAGISQTNEMERLFSVIKPTIGIFTNIGPAHDEGFSSRQQKVVEKTRLFQKCRQIIYCSDYREIEHHLRTHYKDSALISWSLRQKAVISVEKVENFPDATTLIIRHQLQSFTLKLPFSNKASVENSMHCVAFLLIKGFSPAVIQEKIMKLKSIAMRLELKRGINGSYLIDDTYNNDLGGFEVALDFLSQQKQKPKRTIILSDVLQSGLPKQELYTKISQALDQKHVDRLIGIGPDLYDHQRLFYGDCQFFKDTSAFLSHLKKSKFAEETILIKGARHFAFERIVAQLQQKIHGTVLSIDLNALTHNLNFFRKQLKPETKIMVMVKAFAYGSGLGEIANLLQFHRIDYLGVAYADEGIALRENGINLPIMVMNPSTDSFAKMVEYRLEPEIYSLRLLKELIDFHAPDQYLPLHLKLDTGMHRLGFSNVKLPELINLLKENPSLKVKTIFSHLAAADESVHDEYSLQQLDTFQKMNEIIKSTLQYQPLRHILNSAGIAQFPQFQYEMVRLGIGLYGIDPSGKYQDKLQNISTLKTQISQIKHLPKGSSVGYGRKGKLDKDATIATIGIGYADGFSRAFSNGIGSVLINGQMAPVIGNVCMDMTMIDISHLKAAEGDEVILFGKELAIQSLADSIGTIPYEILTNISERVKRVFHKE